MYQPASLQIAVQNPLVSERMELSVLYKEYADDDHVYQQKIKVTRTTTIPAHGLWRAAEMEEWGGALPP